MQGMPQTKQQKLIEFLGILALIAVFISVTFALLGMIGAVNLNDGCFLRYGTDGKGNTDTISKTVTLDATANYTTTNSTAASGQGIVTQYDPNHYGEWLNTNLAVSKGQIIKVTVKGDVSLCQAYVPQNNLRRSNSDTPGKSNLDDNNQKIPIPRVADVNSQPLSLIFDATIPEWRNITELYPLDQVVVSVSPNYAPRSWVPTNTVSVLDVFKNSTVTTNCATQQSAYDSSVCSQVDATDCTGVTQATCNQCSNPGATCTAAQKTSCAICTNTDGIANCATQKAQLNTVCGTALVTADCSAGKSTYSPVCGRYSIYSGPYVANCRWDDNYWNSSYNQNCDCCVGSLCACFLGVGKCAYYYTCGTSGAWNNVAGTAPEPYQDNGLYTLPSTLLPLSPNDLSTLYTNFNPQCSNNATVIPPRGCDGTIEDHSIKDADFIRGVNAYTGSKSYQNLKYFWFSADYATGLLYRTDSNSLDSYETPTNASALGNGYDVATVATDQSLYAYYNTNGTKYRIIYNQLIPLNAANKSYLQYRFYSGRKNGSDTGPFGQAPTQSEFRNNTGGYILNIKQTKCRRSNGQVLTDAGFANRGQVQYIIAPSSQNPNYAVTDPDHTTSKPRNDATGNITTNIGDGTANDITAPSDGVVWLRILNNQNDYKDSFGKYTVQFLTSQSVGSFTLSITNPLFEMLRDRVKSAAKTVFENMTCYNGDPNSQYQISSCTNFFLYIKGMLILYVMSYGFMFLLGIVKINQTDLVIRIIKIAIVSGLMNGNTFNFFNNYVFDTVTQFSDAIISNMSGYGLFTSTNQISNPFMFLDALMSKILFSKTFLAQFMALLSMGLSGLIYFVIVFVSLCIVIITALRAIAVYIMAFMAIAVLIGLAPLFLTFMLFDFTRYLFDNWVRFTIRYMMEPVILLAGIIILTQLYTIYLDFATGYSVCWKCAITITIPFNPLGGLPGFLGNLANLPLFCINWFGAWGMDYRTGMMGINMQHFIALIILAYGMYGYVEYSGKIVAKLTSATTTGPSATGMGQRMSGAMEQGALKKVGLDAESRAQIVQAAKGRLTQRNKTLDKAAQNRQKLDAARKSFKGMNQSARKQTNPSSTKDDEI